MFIALAFGIFAAILAYLIGEGQSFSHLIFSNTNYSLYFALAFWLFMSMLTRLGLKALKKGEAIGVILVLILIIIISLLSINKIDISNLTYSNPQNFFTPFGVILFAFLAFAIIPEIEEELGKDSRLIKKVVITGHIIIFTAYLLFAIAVLGWKGSSTPQLATLALGKPFILFGILTMFTAYFALSIALIDALRFDYKLSKNSSWLIVSIIPLILYIILTFTNSTNFTNVLGIGGVISGGLTAILILLMVPKAKLNGDRKPEYTLPYSKLLTFFLILIFAIATLAEIWSIIKPS
jgi:amino acid permease